MALNYSDTLVRDNLFSAANQVQPIVTMQATIASGAGKLSRGTILAASNVHDHDVAKAASKWTAPECAVAVLNVYKKSAPTVALVYSTDYTVARNANGRFEVSAVAGGAIESEAGNLIIRVLSEKAAGKLKKLGTDNYLIPVCILDKDVDATLEDVETAAYFTGEFNSDKLIVAAGSTVADYRLELARIGIFAK